MNDDELIYINGLPHDESELEQIADTTYASDRSVDRYALKRKVLDTEKIHNLKQDKLKNK